MKRNEQDAARGDQAQAGKEPAGPSLGHVEMKEPDFRELTRLRAFDRQMHIQKSLEAGLSREEAEAHVDADLRGRERDDARP